jgi:predicted lipid carrier protein YhbT
MSGTLHSLLSGFAQRLQHKAHLHALTSGWERRVGIVVEDVQIQFCLTFSRGVVVCTEWLELEPVDLVLRGRERELAMLFGGEELVYLRAKELISMKGAIRDQLKLDALLRLTC